MGTGTTKDVPGVVRRRGDAIAAIRFLVRAAELSPSPADRSRRMARAAYLGAVGADVAGASRVLDNAVRASLDRDTALLSAAAAGYTLVNGAADIDTAHRVVVAAVEAHGGGFRDVDQPLGSALQVLGFVCALGMRRELWSPFHEFVSRVTDLGAVSRLSLTNLRNGSRRPARWST